MKYRITEYENGEGKKWWNLQVKSGWFSWSEVRANGLESEFFSHNFDSRDEAIAAIGEHIKWKNRTKIRVVNVEYITR